MDAGGGCRVYPDLYLLADCQLLLVLLPVKQRGTGIGIEGIDLYHPDTTFIVGEENVDYAFRETTLPQRRLQFPEIS